MDEIDSELRRLREALENAEEDRDTLRAHLAAIDSPETILQDEQHPNGLTPAMRAVRTAIAQREQAERERDRARLWARTWKAEAWEERRDRQITKYNAQRDEAKLTSALAAATARNEVLAGLVTEQVRATINRDNINGVVRCEWCDGEWLREEVETEVHTETCWVVRARTVLPQEAQCVYD